MDTHRQPHTWITDAARGEIRAALARLTGSTSVAELLELRARAKTFSRVGVYVEFGRLDIFGASGLPTEPRSPLGSSP